MTQSGGGMGRRWSFAGLAPFVALVVVLGFSLGDRGWALRLPEEDRNLRVRGYTLWNKQYLCLAVKVPDPILTGTSTGPMATPEQDDAVEFDFEIPGPQTAAHRLVISAAGGMTLFSRDARGHWRADSSWISGPRTIKYAVTTDGTLNDPNDKDVGYTVECAIPWEFLAGDPRLGGEPPIGREIGFNVVCWMQGENEGIASWSPSVREPAQVGDAARWGKMLIRPGSGLEKAIGIYVACPYIGLTPFIDGKLAADEWLTATTLQFDRPEPMIEVTPRPAERTGVTAAVMAVYRYDWQGDEKASAGAPLWRPDGTPATGHQPQSGAGPWVSYARVDWHAAQLAEIQRAGIDVILAQYSGQESARRTWARSGLERLVQALKERRAAGRGYPLVGMMLDTEALARVDLRSDEGKQLLYGMIREFFLRLPREFWAEIGARPKEFVTGGVPVLLGEPSGLAGWDGGFLDYCQQRFAEDFSGGRLVWLGGSAWRAGGVTGFYSYLNLPADSGFALSSPDGARAAAISPGYCPPPGASGGIRPRMEGRSYRGDWQRVLAAKPELVIINSWNDYANGTEIAPSRQYGVVYVDTTRYYQSRLGSQEPHQLWLKQQRLPDTLSPGTDCQVEFLVENSGTEDLATGSYLSADYEIVRRGDGAVVRKQAGAQGLAVKAGQTQRLPVVISTKDDRGKPLPPGDYLFTLRVVRSKVAYFRSQWFTRGIAELTVPFRVGPLPEPKATLISTSLPSFMESGGTENVVVRLRNDGAATWRMGATKLTYTWAEYRDDLSLPSSRAREGAIRSRVSADLPKDVAPGEVVSVMIPVVAVDAEGKALPPSSGDDLWHYRVEWGLALDGASSPGETVAVGSEVIGVVGRDAGVLLESVESPTTLSAGEQGTADIVVANAGSHPWGVGEAQVACSWYSWDGRPVSPAGEPASGEAVRTPLSVAVSPGERSLVMAPLLAPPTPGPYWLAWHVVADGDQPVFGDSRRHDVQVSPVFVRSADVQPVNLSSHTNTPAVVTDSYRSRGDFDGRGRSLPAELLPPDQTGPIEQLYPSGYYAPAAAEAPIPFAFPDVGSGVGGAVACNGQTVALGEHGARAVHLIVASTEGERETTFGLTRATGDTELVAASVPGWDSRSERLPIAVYCPYVRTLGGDDAARQAYLYHLVLRPREGAAAALELPKEPWIKVLAVTMERAPSE